MQYDLSWRTCEPRCCQRADILVDDQTLHLFNVHLGTAYRERKDQADRLATIVHDGRIAPPKILLGDFNEWSGGLATAALTTKLEAIDLSIHLRRKRTYPGILPLLHLDHIYYEGDVEIAGIEIPRTRKSMMASDHLPFLAELEGGVRIKIRSSVLFFEVFVLGGADARRWTKRFAVVVDGQIADVQVDLARRRLVGDEHRVGAAVEAVAKRHAATASEARVSESLSACCL